MYLSCIHRGSLQASCRQCVACKIALMSIDMHPVCKLQLDSQVSSEPVCVSVMPANDCVCLDSTSRQVNIQMNATATHWMGNNNGMKSQVVHLQR